MLERWRRGVHPRKHWRRSVRMREHWRGMVLAFGILGLIAVVGLALSGNPTATTAARRPAPASPSPTTFAATVGGTLARAAAPPVAAENRSPGEEAADCTRPITTSVTASAGISPAVPLADVLCLVAAAPQIKTVPEDLVPPLEAAEADYGIQAARPCVADDPVVEVPDCTFGDPDGSRTVVVLGDSHAFMWLPAFDQVGKRRHWNVVLLSKSACPPIYASFYHDRKKAPFTECDRWHDYSIARTNRTNPGMAVVISSSGGRNARGESISHADWQAGMQKTLNLMTIPDARKVVFANIPYVRVGNPPNQIVGPSCLAAHLSDAQACSGSRDLAVGSTSQPAARAAALEVGARYIDINPWFCSQQVCTAVIGRMNVYVANGHLSATYATYLSGALQAELQPIMDAQSVASN